MIFNDNLICSIQAVWIYFIVFNDVTPLTTKAPFIHKLEFLSLKGHYDLDDWEFQLTWTILMNKRAEITVTLPPVLLVKAFKEYKIRIENSEC